MKNARRRRKAEQKRVARNVGRLHAVKCDWCNLKMACNCYFDQCRDKPKEAHPLVRCPRCQVTRFLSLVFGGKSRKPRSI
jgi:hypothetical protein